jgi:DNA-binding protein HU-beta
VKARSALLRILDNHATACGLTKKQARRHVEDFLARIACEVLSDDRFHFPGFGTFTATTRTARNVRNPVTKQLMRLPETRSVRFRPSKRGVFARKS